MGKKWCRDDRDGRMEEKSNVDTGIVSKYH